MGSEAIPDFQYDMYISFRTIYLHPTIAIYNAMLLLIVYKESLVSESQEV